MKSKTETRTTTITGLLSEPWEVNADEAWERFMEMSPSERVEAMGSQLHFVIQLPWIELSDTIKRKFWDMYSTPEAERVRAAALHGTKETNHQSEFLFVQQAVDFHHARIEGGYRDRLEDFKTESIGLAYEISEMIARRDIPALRRIITILEEKGMPEGKRSGCGSELGYMLEKFTELHAATRSLPSKARLRDACGLKDAKIAEKMMGKLGLKGLPTEPEL